MRIKAEDILRNVEVKVEGQELKLSGQLDLSVQLSGIGKNVPDELEVDVEDAGQDLKRALYQALLVQADREEVLRVREGKEGTGIQRIGHRCMSFQTRFGTVPVDRIRIMHRADGTTEVPSARAWETPQHDYFTSGLRNAVCDELRDRTVRRTCKSLCIRAGQPDFVSDTTVLRILHEEGARLIAAQRQRAEERLKDCPEAVSRLVPGKTAKRKKQAEVDMELEELSEAGTSEALRIAVGFLDADSFEAQEARNASVESSEADDPRPPRVVDPKTVLTQLDEVKVKAQATWEGKEIWLYTGTVHVEKEAYYFVEATKEALFRQLAAVLSLLGVLDGSRQLLALGDGALWIRNWFEFLRVPGKAMILCWYHLAQRCYQRLSAAGFEKARRQELERELLNHLWTGDVAGALSVLRRVRGEARNGKWIDDMIGYLEKRRKYLPNYQARHKAGLWIASNRVEKWNDWSVSDRCKRRGMSWMVSGVHSLAAHEAARRNGELAQWRAQGKLPPWPVVQSQPQPTELVA